MRRPLVLLLLPILATPASATDLDALEGSLRDTELAFAASLAEADVEAFGSFIDEQAVFVTGTTHRGRPAILDAWKGYFEPGATKLAWRPCQVAVDDAGELGLSTGPYWIVGSETDDGLLLQGTFFSIWRRQEDGSWRIVFDSGTPPAPRPSAAIECR